MNNKLPIGVIFLDALSLPYKHYRLLLKVGLPLIITWVLFAFNNPFSPSLDGNVTHFAISLSLGIAFFLCLVIAIIGCHRIFLLGESVVEKSGLINWTGNEFKYIGWWIYIGLCAAIIAFPIMFIVIPIMSTFLESFFYNRTILNIIGALINIPLIYIISRWSLVLPSSAIDIHGKSLSWSWELTEGNGWRLTLLIGFLPILFDTIFNLLPAFDSILSIVFYTTLWLIIGVVEVGLLSLSYKFLINKE